MYTYNTYLSNYYYEYIISYKLSCFTQLDVPIVFIKTYSGLNKDAMGIRQLKKKN